MYVLLLSDAEMPIHHVLSWRGSYQRPVIHVISPAAHARIELPSQDGNVRSRTTAEDMSGHDHHHRYTRDDGGDDGVRINLELRVTGDYRLQLQDLLILHVDERELVLQIPVLDFFDGKYHIFANDPGSHSFSARLQSKEGVVIAQTTITFEVVPFPTKPAIPRQEVGRPIQSHVLFSDHMFLFSSVVLMLICVLFHAWYGVVCPSFTALGVGRRDHSRIVTDVDFSFRDCQYPLHCRYHHNRRLQDQRFEPNQTVGFESISHDNVGPVVSLRQPNQ
jgi:hypothetical protein